MHQNMQGIANKVSELELFLNCERVDVACLSEHWLRGGAELGLCVQGYTVAAMYSRTVAIRGGVCILINDNVKHSFVVKRNISHLNDEFVFEATAVQCVKLKLLIVSVYRSPNGDINVFFEKFNECINILIKENLSIFICGDFNINLLSASSEAKKFKDMLKSFNLRASVDVVTRPCGSGGSCIDNVLTNVGPADCVVRVVPSCISDHEAQVVTFPLASTAPSSSFSNPSSSQKRNFKPSSMQNFASSMSDLNWSSILSSPSVEDQFSDFHALFSDAFDHHFPLQKSARVRKQKPKWINREILQAREDLRDLYILQRDFPILKDLFKQKRALYRRLILSSKEKKAIDHISASSNPSKAVWDVVRDYSTLGKKSSNKSLEKVVCNGVCYSSPESIAAAFNDHFLSLSHQDTSSPQGSISDSKVTPNSSTFFFSPISEEEVFNSILRMKISSTADIYDISPSFIKSIASLVVVPLTILFNNSISQGVFPKVLKSSKVIPVFKKGNANEISNYRPISIVPTFGKVFELLVYNRLLDFFDSFSIVSPTQFGFLKGRSTSHAINSLLSQVISSLDKGERCLGVFCDLSRAFDTVDHDILLTKLETYGVRDLPLNWFCSYLKGRSQCVRVSHVSGTAISNSQPVSAGVPQGSILGPLLFLAYVNQLGTCISSHVVQYADDTSVVVSSPSSGSASSKLETTMNQLKHWFDENRLSLNINKTKIVNFQIRRTEKPFAFPLSDSVVFLGLHIDAGLRWQDHVDHVSKRLSKSLYCLRYLSGFLPKESMKLIYYGTVQTILTYGIMFWGAAAEHLLNRVFVLQKRSIRILCGLNSRESCREHFRNEKILTLPSLFILAISVFVFCNPDSFSSLNHCYDTRHKSNLAVPNHKFAFYEKSVLFLGPKIFNRLPRSIQSCNSLNSFKHNLKSYLVENAFYSLNEYLEL